MYFYLFFFVCLNLVGKKREFITKFMNKTLEKSLLLLNSLCVGQALQVHFYSWNTWNKRDGKYSKNI